MCTLVAIDGFSFTRIIVLLWQVLILVAVVYILDSLLISVRHEQCILLAFGWVLVSRSEHVRQLRIRYMVCSVKLAPPLSNMV